MNHQDRRPQAVDAYTRGLKALPDDTRLLYGRALLNEELDQTANAEKDLRRVVELKPNDADALNALGYTLADRTEHKDEALGLIQKALSLKPDDPAIIDSLGWVQYRLGNLVDAVKSLRRAFERQPDAEIAAHFGEVLWISGNKDEARKVWAEGSRQDVPAGKCRDPTSPKLSAILETMTHEPAEPAPVHASTGPAEQLHHEFLTASSPGGPAQSSRTPSTRASTAR